MTRPIGLALTAALVATLAGCDGTRRVVSNPTSFGVQEAAAPTLRSGQKIAVRNGYGTEAVAVVYQGQLTWEADKKQFTESAAGILARYLATQRIDVDAGASKSITLRVAEMQAQLRGIISTADVVLLVELGNGAKKESRARYRTQNGFQWALDGAISQAVTDLVKDPQFLAYVNGP